MSYEKLVNMTCLAIVLFSLIATALIFAGGNDGEEALSPPGNTVTYTFPDADLRIPLPEGTDEASISSGEEVYARRIWVDISNTDRGFFFKNPFRGESPYIEEAYYSEIDGGIRLNIDVNTPRVPALSVEEGALYISLLSPKEAYGSLVVIDPGHGGMDSGSEADGINEAGTMLKLALLTRQALLDKGIGAVLTRGDEKTPLSFFDRLQLADEMDADLFVTLHADSDPFSSVTGGVKVEYMSSGTVSGDAAPEAVAARAIMYRMIAAGINMNDKLVAPAAQGAESVHVPCVEVKTGYMSNKGDVMLFKDDGYLEKLAGTLARGVEVYLDER